MGAVVAVVVAARVVVVEPPQQRAGASATFAGRTGGIAPTLRILKSAPRAAAASSSRWARDMRGIHPRYTRDMPEIEPRPTASSSRWARRARSLSTTAARCATHARRRPTRRTRCTGAPGRLIRTATALRTLMGGASPGSAGGDARRRSHGDHYVITAWLMCGFIMITCRLYTDAETLHAGELRRCAASLVRRD